MSNYILSVLFVLSTVLVLTSCGNDDDHHHNGDNEVSIMILSPTNGQVISMEEAQNLEIHVIFEATEENHDVEVELYVHGQSSEKIIDWDSHDHDPQIEFKVNVDLSGFASGTEFHLDTKSCVDHDCIDVVTNNITFSIQ